MSTCQVCESRADNATLCNRCRGKLEKAIGDLPALLLELDITITRQDRGTDAPLYAPAHQYVQTPGVHYDEGTTTLPATPWPFAHDAAMLRWAIDNTLSTWLRHLVESRGRSVGALVLDEYERKVDASLLARIMLKLMPSIAQDQVAGDIYDQLI